MRFLVLVILCLASSAQAREVRHDEAIIRWDTERLSIVRGGRDKLVYQHREEKNDRGDVIEAEFGTVLSVVGPWVSISESWYSEGGAHPSYGSNWRTFDAVSGAGVSLRGLFAESVLFAALRKHPVLLEGQS